MKTQIHSEIGHAKTRESNSCINSISHCETSAGSRGNLNPICHLKGNARSISNQKQERYFANAQYDKENATIYRHCEQKQAQAKFLRGNLVDFLATQGDCHENPADSLAMTENYKSSVSQRDCHEFACANSRNDKTNNICHTEGAQATEVSQNLACHIERKRNISINDKRDTSLSAKSQYDNVENNRDTSVISFPQYDKENRLPRATSCARNDNVIYPSLAEGDKKGRVSKDANSLKDVASICNDGFTHPQTPSAREGGLKSKPKKLALSLAASAILATAASLDIAVADCSSWGQANYWESTCSGNMNANDLRNPSAISAGTVKINLRNLTTNGGSKTFAFNRYAGSWATNGTRQVEFSNVNSSSTTFSIGFNVGNWNSVSASNSRIGTLNVEGSYGTHTISVTNNSNITNLNVKHSNNNTNISSSTVGTLQAQGRINNLNLSSSTIGTIQNSNIGNLNANSSTINTLTNGGNLGNLNLNNNSRLGNLTNNAGKTISSVNIRSGSSVSGTLTNNGTIYTLLLDSGSANSITNGGNITTLELNKSRISSLTNNNNNRITNVNLSESTINSLTNNGNIAGLYLTSGSTLGTLSGSGTIGTLSVSSGSTLGTLSGGTITNLLIGSRASSNTGLSATLQKTDFSSATIGNLVINGITLYISSNQSDFSSKHKEGESIKLKDRSTRISAGRAAITVEQGASLSSGNQGVFYKYSDFIKCNGSGSSVTGCGSMLTVSNFRGGSGFRLNANYKGFYLEADASNTYGAGVYRALALANMRRSTMTQNILDTMTTKTFHSDRFYNQEVELRLLQYNMSRLTNRSSKFSKLKRKNEKEIDKVRQKMAKLTLEQSKGQDLDKGYNNFELIDQLDAMFIPYSGRRDWRLFALPYASHTYGYLGADETTEISAGAIFGVQRNLRANGIFGGYIGYEYGNNDTQIAGQIANITDNGLQGGLNYFKTFAIASQVAEGFIKANIRAGVDMPNLNIADGDATRVKLRSDTKLSNIVLMWNAGIEIKGGATFYQFKRNSYIAPEVGLSYDVLSAFNNKIIKTHQFLTNGINDEFYDSFVWHLPQVSAGLRFYKIFGNTFRLNTKLGVKYNILSNQPFSATLKEHNAQSQANAYKGEASATSDIILPKLYGNVAFDLIWMVKKNHELSLGYDGLYFFSSFKKEYGSPTNDWFNGVTTTVNLKYAYWFGGTDYKTDKDGNVIAKAADDKKKAKKSKKDKPKKKKKSKKKVVYIDG